MPFRVRRGAPDRWGLSYVLSTRVTEFTEAADRARTASGRVYALGRKTSVRELDKEGPVALVALRLLLSDGSDGYPGVDDDPAWVTAAEDGPALARQPAVAYRSCRRATLS